MSCLPIVSRVLLQASFGAIYYWQFPSIAAAEGNCKATGPSQGA
jgi:hypothetical protein